MPEKLLRQLWDRICIGAVLFAGSEAMQIRVARWVMFAALLVAVAAFLFLLIDGAD